MQRQLMRITTSICAFALALTPFFHYKGSSVFFFGEPKYPGKKPLQTRNN